MRKKAKASAFILAIALAACSDQGMTRPSSATSAAVAFDRGPSGSNGVQQAVTGHAVITVPLFSNAVQRYTVTAKRKADGSYQGIFDLMQSQGDTRNVVHAETYCFTVVGNTARLAAKILSSTTPDYAPGSFMIWTVTDNHPNANDDVMSNDRKGTPDLSTAVFRVYTPAEADWHCMVGISLVPDFPVKGAINVKDKAD